MFNLLIKNLSTKQTILKNTFWLTLAQGLAGIVTFFLAVFIIRQLGAKQYGTFAFAFSFASLFSALFDFGFSTAITREFARIPGEEKHFPALLTLKLLIGTLVAFFIFIASFFITSDSLTRKTMLVLGFYIFSLEILYFFYALFRARQKMEIEALLRLVNLLFLTIFILTVLRLSPSVLNLSYAYVGTNLATLLIIITVTILWERKTFLFRPVFNLPIWKKFLLIGWYLALAKGMGDITMNTDSVMLGNLGFITENGWYKAAVKINGLILFPMALVSSAVFPALAGILKESKERFVRLWKLWSKASLFLAGFFCSIIFANANDIIDTLYLSEFKPAASALRILVFMAFIAYVHNLYYHVLLIFDQEKKIFFVVLVGALINVVLNLILIPRFGLYGASIATVFTHLIILLQYWRLTSKETFIKPFDAEFVFVLSISIISGISMCLIVSVSGLVKANLFLSISYSALIFSLLFAGLHRIGTKLRFLSA